jgi:cation diffusion facilitator family transporter
MFELKRIRRVLVITLVLNLAVSVAKLAVGYFIRSAGMVADGFHSLFDASSNVIGLIGIQVASRPPDADHPYGHKKYETFAALGVALLLFVTCFEVLQRAFHSLLGNGGSEVDPSPIGFAVMCFSIVVNVFVSRYELKKGRELKSDFLVADSGHTRSDILASASVLASLVAARMGYMWMDAVAAIAVAVLIARVGLDIIRRSSDILCDAARVEADDVMKICLGVPGVKHCHRVRSRGRKDAVNVDLRVHVDPKMTISESHEVGHRVEEAIRAAMPEVVDVVVHLEPHVEVDMGYCRPRP